MRPRRLEITAFGPFATRTEVDLDALADAGLFLVAGPTGAGKTSLLDAMGYALYGCVPGDRRPDGLRSHHADPRVDTEVALEFSLGGDDWRVTRRPPHERAKRRGAGTTQQKAVATLSRRVGDAWEPVCAGVEEVSTTIEASLGLDARQFWQVVVLPQGQVQRALQADARERERLLSSLFDTGRFADVTRWLLDRARDLGEQAARGVEALESLRGEAALRWREVAKETAADDLEAAPADGAAVAALARDARTAAAAADSDCAAAADAAAAADDALSDARLLNARWRRRRSALETASRLAAQTATVDRARGRLRAHAAAAPLRPLLAAFDDAERTCRLADAARDRALRPVAQLAAEAARLAPGLPDAVGAWSVDAPPDAPDVEAAVGVVAEARLRCEGLLDRSAAAAADRLRAARAREEARGHRKAADALRLERSRTASVVADARIALEAAQRAVARLDGEAAEARRLRRQASAAAEVVLLQDAELAARELALDAGREAQDATGAHLRLLQQRIDAMRGALAAGLVDGEECPVCGSPEHPAPADPTAAVSQAEVDDAAARAEVAGARADAAAGALETCRRQLEQARSARGDGCDDPVEAERLAAEAEATAAATRELAGTVAARTRLVDEAETRTHHLETEAAERDGRALTAEARATDADRLAAEHEDAVAAVVGPGVDPSGAVDALGGLASALRAVRAATDARDAARAETDRALARVGGCLAEQGLADAAAARSALLAASEVAALEAEVGEHDASLRLVADVLADPEIAALDDRAAPPDLAGALAASEEARRRADVAIERRTAVRRAADDLTELARRHAEAEAGLVPLLADAARVRHLADVCNGTSNALRMSLERYVLAAHLEQIAEAASVRLAAMTDGRYALRHTDDRARGGGASGLGLVVADAFTGRERDVGTLSGGETFQASLALALGIADVVQARSGGVRLDALFVDEGFGQLDADALEQAMVELDRLREGGRLVGVISHVAALQEQIGVGVRVHRTRTGSTVAVVA